MGVSYMLKGKRMCTHLLPDSAWWLLVTYDDYKLFPQNYTHLQPGKQEMLKVCKIEATNSLSHILHIFLIDC